MYFEKSTEDFKKKMIDYKKFRKILTLLVCISFLISAGYWINPYSNPLLVIIIWKYKNNSNLMVHG